MGFLFLVPVFCDANNRPLFHGTPQCTCNIFVLFAHWTNRVSIICNQKLKIYWGSQLQNQILTAQQIIWLPLLVDGHLEMCFWCQLGNLKGCTVHILQISIVVYTFVLRTLTYYYYRKNDLLKNVISQDWCLSLAQGLLKTVSSPVVTKTSETGRFKSYIFCLLLCDLY